ncbi:segregation and condensation protein B [Naumannella cuiyingiana]|uniref:Segregation and condensation protein B n=1 Tax=Naumannella cuiyingiana TaxID=1347891 RepID=A0A7Z0IMA4_9ACTN|nr:SMC-Scp complex subunit ScpB [Naumannella cuiyingiana]NYI72423.1 segregation and condensation protein B [Naumannella cuiyingiana]
MSTAEDEPQVIAEPDAGPAPGTEPGSEAASPAPTDLGGPVEALLLMAEEAVSTEQLASALQVPVAPVAACLAELQASYDRTGRGFELRNVGGGWRLWTRPEHADVLARAVLEGQQARLSQAALETLAVVAYLQPVSRSRVAAVRGVNVDGVMRTLVARNLVAEAEPDPAGGPATLFRTTDYFLERMGMQSLDELPALAPYLPDAADLEAELGQLAAADPGPASAPDQEATAEDAAPEEPADQAGRDDG